MQEAIPCLCISSPELGKESTFSCWSLNDHLLEELGQGVLPSCCTSCLQEAEDLEGQAPPPHRAGAGRFYSAKSSLDTHRTPNCNPALWGMQQPFKHCPVPTHKPGAKRQEEQV